VSRVRITYSIRLQRLWGRAEIPGLLGPAHHGFNMRAVSGGRAGSISAKPDWLLANNPDASWVKSIGAVGTPGHSEGGPIPPGSYRLLRPGRKGSKGWIPIEPRFHFALGRTDLYIHPEGRHGSDGCIVLFRGDYDSLRAACDVAALSGDGRTAGELKVVDL
jgi:hypothetical protein